MRASQITMLPVARTHTTRSSVVVRRRYSAQPPQAPKEVSRHVGFYKVFTRPIAKVLLLATFTYQLAYFGWVKLETDEIKGGKHAEVKVLEEQLADLTRKPAPKS